MKNCFIIVNYNDFNTTKHLIDNIKNYDSIDEIVIVDNYSREDVIAELSIIRHEKIHIIYNEENLGYSGAINVGARYLIEKYKECNLIISNSDIVILSEEDLIKLIDILNTKNVGLVGPQILEKGNILRGRKDARVRYDICNNLPILNLFNLDDKLLYNNKHYENKTSKVDVISSCFFLISSDVLKKINYMDEFVFLYYEDYILCNKVRKLGLDVLICNDVKIKHLYSISVNKNYNSYEKKRMLVNSQLYYHTTYHEINLIKRSLLKFSCYINLLLSKKR